MSFAQHEYLPFLALVLALFQFAPARARVGLLLLASYAFYSWTSLPYTALLSASTLLDYAVGLGLGATDDARKRKWLLGTSLVVNLGLLSVFKYAGFALVNLNALLLDLGRGTVDWPALALPLGISFYTFQTISYSIDVYRRRIAPCRNVLEYALYVSFFPQLVAGPIERAGRLLPQLRDLRPLSAANASLGGRLILWGLLKKWILAERLMQHAWPRFTAIEGLDSARLALTAVSLLVVLYVDFSAYTDLARGSARLFGVDLVQNFDRPLLSTSIHQYARRWHMSLVHWMYDYVYAPLSRGVPTHWTIWRGNLSIMALFGLWHGASWTFVLWGLCYGVMISWEHSATLRRARRGERRAEVGRPSAGALTTALRWAGTLLLCSQFLVLFFAPDLDSAREFFLAELRLSPPADAAALQELLALGGVLLAALGLHAAGRLVDLPALWLRIGPVGRVALVAGAIGALVVFRAAEPEPFIYFRF